MDNKITQFIFNKIGIPNNKKYLDLASLRHKLVSGNIANISTPGYKAQDIDFNEEFKKVTQNSSRLVGMTTNRNHIPTGQHETKPPRITTAKIEADEMNSVDIDKEIATLARNELMFEVGATLLQRKFEGLRKAIQSR